MELIQVKNTILSDGNRYSGWGYDNNGEFTPHGCGKKFFKGCYAYGNFKKGELNGPAIVSHNMYMNTIQFKNNRGNGWGLCINCGQLVEFGYYENSQLKVDLIDFARWYYTKMENAERRENMLNMYTYNQSHEVAELLIGYKPTEIQNGVGLVGMGFHFMPDGSVWMGNTVTRRFTGELIHFCADGTIDCGEFKDGELMERLELQEIINDYYGTFEFDGDDLFADIFGKSKLDPIREKFRNIQAIKTGYNYFKNRKILQ